MFVLCLAFEAKQVVCNVPYPAHCTTAIDEYWIPSFFSTTKNKIALNKFDYDVFADDNE